MKDQTTINIDPFGRAIIDIEGVIGIPESWQEDGSTTCRDEFQESLNQIKQLNVSEVIVNIRSTGGNIDDAILIYEALIDLSASVSVTTRCYGYVASAATVVSQAASSGQREISPNALFLITEVSGNIEGKVSDIEEKLDTMKFTNEQLKLLYSCKSGKDIQYISDLMSKETWLGANEVIEIGLADKLIDNVF